MLRKLIFFFPLQLLLVNLKRNHLLLIIWVILFGFVSKNIALKYGIPFLFLAPEYLDSLSFFSYFIMGFSIGGFVMVYNISSYIINCKRFPFIATLKNPFIKFCINNSLLPLIFILYYSVQVVLYHLEYENTAILQIVVYVAAILLGYSVNIMVAITYFLSTNKNIFKLLGIKPSQEEPKPTHSLFSRDETVYNIIKSKNQWHVGLYLHTPFKVKYVRDVKHYDNKMLKSVITQNHINAAFFEIVIFISLITLGLFGENPVFFIPAGASIILLFTMAFVLVSAFYTWLKGWTTIILIGLFIIINLLFRYDVFKYDNAAYGLNYETKKAVYTNEALALLKNNTNHLKTDKENAFTVLNNWNAKNKKKQKIIFINTSGGGSRSCMWTFYLLQLGDSLSNGALFNQTHLITGSSGGMIGASYYRELSLRKDTLVPSIYNEQYLYNSSKDLLNPIAFSLATNDLFLRLRKFKDGEYTYYKDRGYAFEKQLQLNTQGVLNKRLKDYKLPELRAEIPMMILSPTVINDGRRMLISSQPISFLTQNSPARNTINEPLVENFEFSRLFKKQHADNLLFTSALRMSSTFPLIMPRVSLPSEPEIAVMDAGMRDNFGSLTTYKYIYTFKDWITENTDGIIIINLRDQPKQVKVKGKTKKSIIERFFSPVGSIYENLFFIQDYTQDDMLQYLSNDVNTTIDVINFELNNSENEISLSWHLTTKEKEKVTQSILTKKNQESLQRLMSLIHN